MAPKYYGYSILAQSYEFYPHLAQLDNLDFTLSLIVVDIDFSIWVYIFLAKIMPLYFFKGFFVCLVDTAYLYFVREGESFVGRGADSRAVSAPG